ncbi:Bzip transcription factor [Phytophthora palmivora]|uniref:Bzip transcription factor n=1 Tax=Phytophthora palmivora TaxID=4796 RepID=A0A2P4YJW2_9STRA|nr:Bzip transcription factor [Phytophthora palmivora]
MSSLLGNPASRFGDNVIGHVLPRIPASHNHNGALTISNVNDLSNLTASRVHEGSPVTTNTFSSLQVAKVSVTPNARVSSVLINQDSVQPKAKKRKLSDYYQSSLRRRQCRTNQARYRNRQREYQANLEQNVIHLHEEVANLKRKYRDLSSRERISHSPWSIVAEVFHLVENSFRSPWRTVNAEEMKYHRETQQILAVLERSFAHDAAFGDLCGFGSLIEQLQCFSQYFADPQLKLLQIESVTPGVMAARAKLGVTVSKLSLKKIFVVDDCTPWHNHLLGQRLELNCTMNFLFDGESSRVVRLECNIDLMVALLRSLKSLNDVSDVLKRALVTPECIISRSQTSKYVSIPVGHNQTSASKSTINSPAVPSSSKKEAHKRDRPDYYTPSARSQHCRKSQTRYRVRQQERQLMLTQSCKRLDLSSRGRCKQSPWRVVTEVFRLLQSSFQSSWRFANVEEMNNHKETQENLAILKRSFVRNFVMGNRQGVRMKINQLRLYSVV